MAAAFQGDPMSTYWTEKVQSPAAWGPGCLDHPCNCPAHSYHCVDTANEADKSSCGSGVADTEVDGTDTEAAEAHGADIEPGSQTVEEAGRREGKWRMGSPASEHSEADILDTQDTVDRIAAVRGRVAALRDLVPGPRVGMRRAAPQSVHRGERFRLLSSESLLFPHCLKGGTNVR